MTLLTLCQAVADEVGVNRPGTIIGNPDRAARRLLTAANREGRELAKRNWSILKREHTWTTVADQDVYDLPSDYESLQADSAWDRTNYWNMRGGLTSREWQIRRNAIIATTAVRKMYRVSRGANNSKQFFVDPKNVPGGQELLIEYRSNGWCQSNTGVIQTRWLADDDSGILDETLMELGVLWRYLMRTGSPYVEEYNEYVRVRKTMLAQDGPNRTLRVRPARVVIGAINVPEGNYG